MVRSGPYHRCIRTRAEETRCTAGFGGKKGQQSRGLFRANLLRSNAGVNESRNLLISRCATLLSMPEALCSTCCCQASVLTCCSSTFPPFLLSTMPNVFKNPRIWLVDRYGFQRADCVSQASPGRYGCPCSLPLYLHLTVPTCSHDVSYPVVVVLIRLVHLHVQRSLSMEGIQADCRQPHVAEGVPEPGGERATFQTYADRSGRSKSRFGAIIVVAGVSRRIRTVSLSEPRN